MAWHVQFLQGPAEWDQASSTTGKRWIKNGLMLLSTLLTHSRSKEHCTANLSWLMQPNSPWALSNTNPPLMESPRNWSNAANLELGSKKDFKIIVQVKEFLYLFIFKIIVPVRESTLIKLFIPGRKCTHLTPVTQLRDCWKVNPCYMPSSCPQERSVM